MIFKVAILQQRTENGQIDCKGISTSRSETNCTAFLGRLELDILITSGGALIRKGEEHIFKEVFSKREKRIVY